MDTETLRPSEAGDYTNITSQFPDSTEHWDKVDEVTADEWTTYVSQVTDSELKDVYGLENPSDIGGADTINSVTVHFRVSTWNTSTTVKAIPYLRLGTDETAGTEVSFFQGDTGWLQESEVLARPGGGDWSLADLNNLQVGIGIWNTSALGRGSGCTQIYVVVDYTPAVVGRSFGSIIG